MRNRAFLRFRDSEIAKVLRKSSSVYWILHALDSSYLKCLLMAPTAFRRTGTETFDLLCTLNLEKQLHNGFRMPLH